MACSSSSKCTTKKTTSLLATKRTTPRVFVCSHPHAEPPYGRKAIGTPISIPWNTKTSHWRKFISRSGQYISSNGTLQSDTIYFWGEYEPGSSGRIINKTTPKALHDKLTPVRGSTIIPHGALNTDPYVFGDHFKYICCRMGNKKHIPGDVILFGHFDSETLLFDLDTVIVIKEMIKIDPKRNTSQYYKASIEPLKIKGGYFYKGYNYSENKCFSFVPCLVQPILSIVPPWPSLDLNSYGFDVKKCWYGYVAASIPFSEDIWQQLIQDVTEPKTGPKWLIGTHVDKV